MDRHTWMYKIPRATADYIKGVEDFITYAMLYLEKKHKEEGKEQMILCPCRDCNNFKKYRSVDTVRDHLFRRGFKEGYEKWIWHGEGLDSTRTSGTKRGREEDSMEKNDEEDMENDRVIDPIMLDTLQYDIIVTLCEFEIFLCTLKAYVRNRYRPEGSIIEGYSIEETIEFCTEYLATVDPIGIPKSRHEGRLEGHGTLGSKMISPSAELCDRAHLFVLQHMTEVDPYLKEHIALIRQMHPLKSGKWVTNEHNRSFGRWFKERVMSQLSQRPDVVSNTLKWLAYGPDMPRRILGIENVEDEDEYDQFDENPPFSMGVSTSYENEFVDADYIRNDHDEGVWIDGQIFMMYIHKLCKDLEDNSFAFMCPSVLALARESKYHNDTSRYMCEVMTGAKEKRFVLAPYIQSKHWMLLMFCVDESAVYVFDPLKQKRHIHVKDPFETSAGDEYGLILAERLQQGHDLMRY
ncbi:hypothetical protein POM88_045921 [Heracleum sosnowskyi]|uniref:Transposase n=1 Tax=Heracleum sosnowskyi TaxID=360622 RepID=A0AAD8H5D4_9APIA|nr:hypothetical protein POM88_045921 [Heracleum sosnowskyi]